MIGYDTFEYASLTDVGIRRPHNEDAHASLLASDPEQWRERGHIFIVADGMGGHAVGELASELAVSIIPHTYYKHANHEGVPALRKAFVEANASIHAKGQQNPEFCDMGTVTTALLLRPEGAWIAHVGDSRAYRIRDGHIDQLSFDHSLVWELARQRGVDPDGLRGISSNVIVRCLGREPLVQVDVEGPHPIRSGDIFVLCSDGLSGQVSDSEIGAIAGVLPPAEACRVLVDLANQRGGPDNITVVIVRVSEQAGSRELSRRRRPGLLAGVPWPLPALILGVLLATVAGLLVKNDLHLPAVATFVIAAAAILTGLVGLILYYKQEWTRKRIDWENHPLQIYRQASCHVDEVVIDKMVKALGALKQQIDENHWDMDWTSYQQLQEPAEKRLSEGKNAEAYREYCRALHVLAEVVQRNRPKGEGIRSAWE